MANIVYDGFVFSPPALLHWWTAPRRPGIYVVQVLDGSCGPQPFRPIYVGQSGNLAERGFPHSHHAYDRWVREAGSEWALWISAHDWLWTTDEARRLVERRLIDRYNPCCNRETPLSYFARFVEAQGREQRPSPSLGSLARLFPEPAARPGSLAGLLDLYTRSGK